MTLALPRSTIVSPLPVTLALAPLCRVTLPALMLALWPVPDTSRLVPEPDTVMLCPVPDTTIASPAPALIATCAPVTVAEAASANATAPLPRLKALPRPATSAYTPSPCAVTALALPESPR